MSTADEIMLRAQETQRRLEPIVSRWSSELLRAWLNISLWRLHLYREAEATRYQLTWNGKL